MPSERNDLTALEAALTGLAPSPPRTRRDRLLYAAGRAAGSRPWKQAACGFAGLSLALTLFVFARPPRTVDRPIVITVPVEVPVRVEVPVPASPSAADTIAQTDPPDSPMGSPAAELRQRVLRWGPDALPTGFESHTAVVAPPSRPLELDLDLPPGSLNGVDPRRSFSSPAPW